MNETSFELPPLSDIATAALAVGLLFLLRYGLAMRRAGAPRDWLRGPKALAFGSEDEPSRRYAARQRVLSIVFLAIGAAVLLWSVLRPAGA